jgi:predicted DNA repair protein MutK
MASGIFAVLDDVAALMDDVAVASKIATKKTAGILGDDLAVNAEKATGFLASREIPVLWAITKGSLLNKLIIVPIALLLTAFTPLIIRVILVLGGCYLAYEGVEKIFEFLFHRPKKGEEVIEEVKESGPELEKSKVKAAITTDFILSIEIVIIALGSVIGQSLTVQILTVSVVALLATVGVYGFVALIVRMDDIGFRLIKLSGAKGTVTLFGKALVRSLPIIIKLLSVIGTVALLLVSGGIFMHNIEYLHHLMESMPAILGELLLGFGGGIVLLAVVKGVKLVIRGRKSSPQKHGGH